MVAKLIVGLATSTLSVSSTLSASAECYYHVTDQTLKVEKPDILQFDVEKYCPWSEGGDVHEQACSKCGEWDTSCAGQFIACAGCCDLLSHKRYHQCDNIKTYLTLKNSHVLDCDARMDLPDGDVNVEYGLQTIEREDRSIQVKCDIPAERKKDSLNDLVPLKVKFDCSNCAVGNVPAMLKACCNKADAYSQGPQSRKFEQDGFKMFLWADGCEESTLERFPQLKESQIDKDIDEYIEKQFCSKGVSKASDNCAAGGYDRDRRLAEDFLAMNKYEANSSHNFDLVYVSNSSSRSLQADSDCSWVKYPAGEGESDSNAASTLSLSSSFSVALISHLALAMV